MRTLAVARWPIQLVQVLKSASLVESGAEAKAAVEAGVVRVNGAPESRKRRQLQAGDVVEVVGFPPVRLIDAPAGDCSHTA
jgi:ribosome-associated protein